MPDRREPCFHFPAPLVDTHFHAMPMYQRGMDALTLLETGFREGLAGAVEVAVDEEDFDRRLELTSRFEKLRLTAGIHPSALGSSLNDWVHRFETVRVQARAPEVVGIGETGLDFFRDYSPQSLQERAFHDHLELSATLGKPVIVHNRSADSRVLDIVRESSCRSGVFHCFSSDWALASEVLDAGFYISFAGNISYKNTELIRETAAKVPADRLLIETDSPYLSPQRVRGQPNHPGHIGYTLEVLAGIRGEDLESLAGKLQHNAEQLFHTTW